VYATKGKETITRVLSVSVPANLFQRVASPACAGAQSLFYRFVAWRSQPIDSILHLASRAVPAELSSSPYLPSDSFFCYFICINRFSLLSQTSRNGPISSHILNFFLQPANRFYAATLAAEVIYNLLLFFLEKNCNFLNR